MSQMDGAAYYKMREARELQASAKAADPMIKRLHWEMAQRYAFLASEAVKESDPEIGTSDLPSGTVSM